MSFSSSIMRAGIPLNVIKRFNRYIVPGNSEDCWLWQGYRNKEGYGILGMSSGGNEKAHRLAYALYKGDVPENIFVLHKCDNTSCCNPSHLFLGTHTDNMQDMYKKGRHKIEYVSGSKSKCCVLKPSFVLLARELWLTKKWTQGELAKLFNCSQQCISNLILGKTYQDVEGVRL